MHALIIEDEKLVGYSLSKHLEKLNFTTTILEYGKEGIKNALDDPPDILFVDYRLPDLNGIEVLHELQSIREQTSFFFMTAYGANEVAVEALKLGSYEYLNKPLNFDEITLLVKRALKDKKITQQIGILKEREEKTFQLGSFISYSKEMKKILETVKKLVRMESGTVLLLGETGTGKDTLARLIHEHSVRKEKSFIVTNCASLPETLLESELFGYEKGAFTDAKARKFGQLELADGGTLYLDEIGEIPINFQAKFLRFVETQKFYRVGGTKELEVSVRIIASTNRELRKEMERGNFREDLFFRLDVITITLPPLRERKEDIEYLAKQFVERFNKEFHLQIEGFTKNALEMLTEYKWPGNVRELRNTIERIFLLEQPKTIETWHFPSEIREEVLHKSTGRISVDSSVKDSSSFFEGKSLAGIEKQMIKWALDKEKGNQTRAAKRLEVSRDQIRYQMKKYNILPTSENRDTVH